MTKRRNQGNFTRQDLYDTEPVRAVVQSFVSAFEDKGAAPTLEQLLDSSAKTFVGGNVRKQPERFTREELIEPCFEALGYEVNGDPVKLVKEDPKQPDLELQGVGTSCVCIAECKALNKERDEKERDDRDREEGDATESLKDRYLSENAFATHKQTRDFQYLVGFATDGFVWNLYLKDVINNESKHVAEASLLPLINRIYNKRYSGSPEQGWPEFRKQVAEEFIADFAARNIPQKIRHCFE